MKFHFQVCGIYITTSNSNYYAPAIQFQNGYFVIRTNNCLETTVFYHNGKLDWNSEHIGRRFGKLVSEGDEELGYPPIWDYEGLLGYHQCGW